MTHIDETSPELPVRRLYELISGPADQERPWDTIKTLFLDGARLHREQKGKDGTVERRDWSLPEFMEDAAECYRSRGFWEKEIAHRTERFGNVAHVLSTYETRIDDPDSMSVVRGINSIQLLLREGRWRIASLLFHTEEPGAPIPPEFLSSQGFTCGAIGTIHSPHSDAEKTPVQPVYASGIKGRVEVFPEYADGLGDLDGFSFIYLIYAFDRAGDIRLRVKPFLDECERGVFATRAPCRPNSLGISLVRLVSCKGPVLEVEDIDILDGTPLLDIKPYVTRFDSRDDARCGWQDAIDDETARVRGRRKYDKAP